MNVFRKVLIVCGAAWVAADVVNFLRWGLLPMIGIRTGYGSSQANLFWALGAVTLFGILAGVIGAAALQVDRLGWWALLIIAVSWLGSPAYVSRRAYPDALSYALAEFKVGSLGVAVTLITFIIVRASQTKRLGSAR